MKGARFRLASMMLPAMILASMAAVAAEAKEQTGSASGVTAVADEARPGKAKSGRLRFRSADGTCACTCAKGGATEAEIRRAEEQRAGTRN